MSLSYVQLLVKRSHELEARLRRQGALIDEPSEAEQRRRRDRDALEPELMKLSMGELRRLLTLVTEKARSSPAH